MAPRWIVVCLALITAVSPIAAAEPEPARPNILWITCEDISPNLGCYGDTYASTPNLDRLATEGVRYTHAFAPIGVCAPSRSTLITGMYACSIGTQHMRCTGQLPEAVKCFTEHLRQAGRPFCTGVFTHWKPGRTFITFACFLVPFCPWAVTI